MGYKAVEQATLLADRQLTILKEVARKKVAEANRLIDPGDRRMKVTETTPPHERTFVIECSEDELYALRVATSDAHKKLEHSNSDFAERVRAIEALLYSALEGYS